MQIVALDLRPATEMAFDQDRVGVSAERYCRRVVHRLARDDIFRLANVGDDGLERELDASRHAGQAERGTHDFEESAAPSLAEPFRSTLGKLAVTGFCEWAAA